MMVFQAPLAPTNAADSLRLWLVIGQYGALPFFLWIGRSIKRSIDIKIIQSESAVKDHVTLQISEHEDRENLRFHDLSERTGRIEGVLMNQAVPKINLPKRRSRVVQ